MRVVSDERHHEVGYHAPTFGPAEEFLKSKQFSNTSCIITDLIDVTCFV
jgi:hypothetical protein